MGSSERHEESRQSRSAIEDMRKRKHYSDEGSEKVKKSKKEKKHKLDKKYSEREEKGVYWLCVSRNV